LLLLLLLLLLLQGVDYWTIHAGVLLRHIPLTANRITGGWEGVLSSMHFCNIHTIL
jgi:thiamine biosynthesis protein ThiC